MRMRENKINSMKREFFLFQENEENSKEDLEMEEIMQEILQCEKIF